jgi:hypothetical protein
MLRLSLPYFGAICAAFMFAGDAAAQVVSTTNLTCSSTRRLQTAINNVPAGTVGTINVTGTCTENIVIPHGKTITIVGATSTSRIVAANNTRSAIRTFGETTIQKMAVVNSNGTSDLLVEVQSGRFTSIASDLQAPSVTSVLAAIGRSHVIVINSRIAGGSNALESWGGSTINLRSEASDLAGPLGLQTVISSPNGSAIGCQAGGSVVTRASNPNTPVKIHQVQSGIVGAGCTYSLKDLTIQLQGVGTGIGVWQSQVLMSAVSVLGGEWGVNSNMTDLTIFGSTFANHSNADIAVGNGSTVSVDDLNGSKSSFPNIGTGNKFQCWAGSSIYLNSTGVLQALTNLPDLPACVTIN